MDGDAQKSTTTSYQKLPLCKNQQPHGKVKQQQSELPSVARQGINPRRGPIANKNYLLAGASSDTSCLCLQNTPQASLILLYYLDELFHNCYSLQMLEFEVFSCLLLTNPDWKTKAMCLVI